jgi:hypothetical protein
MTGVCKGKNIPHVSMVTTSSIFPSGERGANSIVFQERRPDWEVNGKIHGCFVSSFDALTGRQRSQILA